MFSQTTSKVGLCRLLNTCAQQAKFLIPFFCAFLISDIAFSQSENYIKGWEFIGESDKHVDIFYAVMSCDEGDAQLYIQVFNEHSKAQKSSFTISLAAEGLPVIQHDFNEMSLELAEMRIPSCQERSFPELILDIPKGYDAHNLTVSVEFN